MGDISGDRLLAHIDSTIDDLVQGRSDAEGLAYARFEGGILALRHLHNDLKRGTYDLPSADRVPLDQIAVPTKLKVRAKAPDTSWEAASAQTPEKSRRLYDRILLALHAQGPANDDELRRRLKTFLEHYKYSPEGVTMRRGELVKAGWVRYAGWREKGDSGASMRVWEFTP